MHGTDAARECVGLFKVSFLNQFVGEASADYDV